MSFTIVDFFRHPRCKIRENQHPRCYHRVRENRDGRRYSVVCPTYKSIHTIFTSELCPLNHFPFQHGREKIAHQFTLFSLVGKPCTIIHPFSLDTSKLDHLINFYIVYLQYSICLDSYLRWMLDHLVRC